VRGVVSGGRSSPIWCCWLVVRGRLRPRAEWVLCHRSEPPRCDRRHVVEYHAHDPGRRQRSILPLRRAVALSNRALHRGNFGIAAHYFRDAVEKAPRDASAWIGLAASYDMRAASISPIKPTSRPYCWQAKAPRSSTIVAILTCSAVSLTKRAGDLTKGMRRIPECHHCQ